MSASWRGQGVAGASPPQEIAGLSGVTAVAGSHDAQMRAARRRIVWCWGRSNPSGQLATGRIKDEHTRNSTASLP